MRVGRFSLRFYLALICFVVPSTAASVFGIDEHWPFSNFPMYSQPYVQQGPFREYRLMGIGADGQAEQIQKYYFPLIKAFFSSTFDRAIKADPAAGESIARFYRRVVGFGQRNHGEPLYRCVQVRLYTGNINTDWKAESVSHTVVAESCDDQ